MKGLFNVRPLNEIVKSVKTGSIFVTEYLTIPLRKVSFLMKAIAQCLRNVTTGQ